MSGMDEKMNERVRGDRQEGRKEEWLEEQEGSRKERIHAWKIGNGKEGGGMGR